MRYTACLMILTLAPLAWAEEKKNVKQSPAKPAENALPAGLPAGAREIEKDRYRWVDSQGKAWIYQRSPFGWLKGEEAPAESAKPPELPPGLKVTEEGDSLRFERPYPFGTLRWVRKKSELTEMEQEAWKREQAKKASAKSTEKEK